MEIGGAPSYFKSRTSLLIPAVMYQCESGLIERIVLTWSSAFRLVGFCGCWLRRACARQAHNIAGIRAHHLEGQTFSAPHVSAVDDAGTSYQRSIQ